MKRRDFLTRASITAAYGIMYSQLAGSNGLAMTSMSESEIGPKNVWDGLQKTMGYSDEEMEIFIKQPRTEKIIARLENLSKTPVIFEVKKSQGCLAGHKPGDFFLFPSGSTMDLKNSTHQLCPFLMPPMTRIMWILQERVWEGLEPLPIYATGHCDDVGLDCNGWGRVVIEARLLEPAELESLIE